MGLHIRPKGGARGVWIYLQTLAEGWAPVSPESPPRARGIVSLDQANVVPRPEGVELRKAQLG